MRKILPFLLVLSAVSSALAANPTTTSISPTSTIAGSGQFTLTVNGTNFDSTSVVRWNGSNLATTFVSSTQVTAIVPAANVAAPGTASITVKNSTGSASNAQTFTIKPPPPVITSSLTATGQVGVAFSYQIQATNSPTSYNATGLPAGLSVNTATGLISGTPAAGTDGASPYSVTISATNSGGSGSATLTLTIKPPPPPVITSSLTATGQVGVAFSYQIQASNSPTSYNASGLPAGLSVNTATGLISGTPAAGTDAGSPYAVTISATNSGGTGSATLTLTIKPPAPVITSPTTATGQVGVAFSYQITATNNPTSFNATGLPGGLSVNTSTGLISGTPTTAGTSSVTISATNSGGTGSATLTLTIKPAPPVITSALTKTGQVGVAFSYTITATNSPTSYNATALPTGLSVNTSTGVISGTPTTAGIYSVTISATNSGGTGTATLVITINNQVPTTTSINPNCVTTASTGFTLTVTGTNFVFNSVVNWNGSGLTTTFVSSTQLTAIVPAALVATGGTASVTVANPAPGGGTSNAQTFTIAATPVIQPPLTASGTIGVAFSYTITATNSPTSYTATGLPPGLKLEIPPPSSDLGLIDGTPTTAGTYNVTITATNGTSTCNTDTETLVITICPDTPSITSLLTATATVGTPFTYQITADNNPTSFDATDLPGGLTVDTTTGLISGTPTGAGVFPVTISATNNTSTCMSTATATLTLTVNLPSGVLIPSFPGQINVFDTGLPSSGPQPSGTIPFPNPTSANYFELYWNLPASTNQNPHIADLARGGLQRNQDLAGMSYNKYTPPARPDLTKNVWRGNPSPPNDNSSGQFGDPRASWYISDPWPTADYVTGSYWAGPSPNMIPLNWPDSGHAFGYTGLQPPDKGQYPADIMAGPTPTPDPAKSVSLLSTSTSGNLASITELGNVWDPAQLSYLVTNPGGALPDIPGSATLSSKGGGGHTLAIGRPEFSAFDKNGMRAWQLLDVFSANGGTNVTTSTAGRVNLNTASRDVLRALAAGILQNRDPAILPTSLLPQNNGLYPPSVSSQADLFADAVINSRPLLSTAALSAIRVTPPNRSQPEPFFGNPDQYSNQTAPTEWNDTGREELFAKIYNLATTRSRNFRVFVTGQSLDKNGNVLSTVTKVYQVFVKPNRAADGTILSQQVVIKYEGSM